MERREKYLHMERREDWNLQAPEPQQAVRSLQAPPMHSCWARTEESSHLFFFSTPKRNPAFFQAEQQG